MYNPLLSRINDQFYAWEGRGRGWQVWNYPVELEPPFEPYQIYKATEPISIKDEGFLKRIYKNLTGSSDRHPIPQSVRTNIPPPQKLEGISDYKEIQIILPKGEKFSNDEAQGFILMLSNCYYPISFEILGTNERITIQYVCRKSDFDQLINQLTTYFPKIILTEEKKFLEKNLSQNNGVSDGISFGLAHEFMFPIRNYSNFSLDPLTGLLSVLDNLQEGETALMQIIFKGVSNPWVESIVRAVMNKKGESIFKNSPEKLRLTHQKISKPLFSVVINTLVQGQNAYRTTEIMKNLTVGFAQFNQQDSNQLVQLDHISNYQHYNDIILRQSHRSGMILNSDELISIVHFPYSFNSAKLHTNSLRKTKAAPAIATGNNFILGVNTHEGKQKTVSISTEQRLKHFHILGSTGSGKSTLIENLIIQDIQNGKGVAALDPHGDLIENIMTFIPEKRFKDIILIDPADSEWPVGINILQAHSEIEKDVLASDLVSIFQRYTANWGAQMSSILSNAIASFVESKAGGSLMDLKRFLVDEKFRNEYLKTVTEPSLVYYWKKEFPLMRSGASIGPIITRLDTFLRSKLIRNMIAQREGLNFDEIINSNKILLIKLSQGLIGAESSYILGSLIVSKLHQAAIARQLKSAADRKEFYLYCDEAHNFLSPSMSSILTGTRKYSFGLILSHQDLGQLSKQDNELANSVLIAGTRICFRVGEIDAKKLADGFSFFEAKDLQNLGTGEALVRIERPDFDFNLATNNKPVVDSRLAESRRKEIVTLSRDKYSKSKTEIEAEIARFYSFQEIAKEEKFEKTEQISGPVDQTKKVSEPEIKKTDIKSDKISDLLVEAIKGPKVITTKQKTETEHRYYQNFIKRTAESFGFKATIEEGVPGGKVDVGLIRNGFRIAIEISSTTTDAHELKNAKKCLVAGYNAVIVCPTDKKNIEKLKKITQTNLTEAELNKIFVFEPGEIPEYLSGIVANDNTSHETIKGYKVKVKFKDEDSEEKKKDKRETISKMIYGSIKKLKKE